MSLPSRGNRIEGKDSVILKNAAEAINYIINKFNEVLETGNTNADVMKFVGEVWDLNTPEPFRISTNDETFNTLTIKFGAFEWTDMVINSIGITIPPIVYDGGYP